MQNLTPFFILPNLKINKFGWGYSFNSSMTPHFSLYFMNYFGGGSSFYG
jgi:hypothetical protein